MRSPSGLALLVRAAAETQRYLRLHCSTKARSASSAPPSPRIVVNTARRLSCDRPKQTGSSLDASTAHNESASRPSSAAMLLRKLRVQALREASQARSDVAWCGSFPGAAPFVRRIDAGAVDFKDCRLER